MEFNNLFKAFCCVSTLHNKLLYPNHKNTSKKMQVKSLCKLPQSILMLSHTVYLVHPFPEQNKINARSLLKQHPIKHVELHSLSVLVDIGKISTPINPSEQRQIKQVFKRHQTGTRLRPNKTGRCSPGPV